MGCALAPQVVGIHTPVWCTDSGGKRYAQTWEVVGDRRTMKFMQDTNRWAHWENHPVNEALLREIQSAWEGEAGADEFQAELGMVFNGIADDLGRKDISNEYLVLKENGTPRAVLELVDTKRGAMTKLLSLHLSPTYWDSPTHTMLADVYSAAITSVLAVGTARANRSIAGTHEIKIYGRNRELLDILRAINDNWTPTPPIEVSMAGRWLSVTLR